MGRTLGTHLGEVRVSRNRLPGTRDQPVVPRARYQPAPVRCTGSAGRAQGLA